MAGFSVKIYRWPAPCSFPAKSSTQQTQYIMLITDANRRGSWFKAETLFGLRNEIGVIDAGNWEDIERQVTETGYYELSR